METVSILKQPKIDRTLITRVYQILVRVVLSVLIFTLLGVMAWIAVNSMFSIKSLLGHSLKEMAETIIVNSLLVLALLEVFLTALTYFSEGRVRVTFIIDTVFVMVLSDTMAFWFTEIETERMIMLILLVFTLVIARILTIRFSPSKGNRTDI